MVRLKVLVLCLASIGVCHGFLGAQRDNGIVKKAANPLYAKAAKKKKRSTPTGAGFGKAPELRKTREASDFSVFPALEDTVAATLVPSVSELINEPGELPGEIYDRLNQIYGFTNFNYLTPEEIFTPLVDLISAPSTTGNSKISDGNFASLLANATGETIPTPPGEAGREDSTIDAISKLKPFTRMRVLHIDPLVLAIDDFFADDECDRYIAMSTAPSKNKKDSAPFQTNSMTVGKDAQAKAQRTSTTWFHHFKSAPELMAKASRLLGLKGIDRWEEPQTVRYRRQEKFTWHLDALSPSESADSPGGQRTATLLVYLSELSKEDGGATIFRDLSADGAMLKVQPKKGTALLFFPAAGGIPKVPFDIRTLHCGEAVSEASIQDKWISQLWLRERTYTPTAPAGNNHADATEQITQYCVE